MDEDNSIQQKDKNVREAFIKVNIVLSPKIYVGMK